MKRPKTEIEPVTNAVYPCIDMQNISCIGGIWQTPWMERVLPSIVTFTALQTERSSRGSLLRKRPISARPVATLFSPLEADDTRGAATLAAAKELRIKSRRPKTNASGERLQTAELETGRKYS